MAAAQQLTVTDFMPCIVAPEAIGEPVKYENDGNRLRFIAIDRQSGKGYVAIQGGLTGQTVDYVRVDESLDVTIHSVIRQNADGSLSYDPRPLHLKVTWS